MTQKNMWDGRFSGAIHDLVLNYTESTAVDRCLYQQDIAGSKAHARMLARQGVLSETECAKIVEGLEQVRSEIEDGTFVWRKDLEDVHMNVEQRLTELIGSAGEKLHTGRSRNDQVALDFRLFAAEKIDAWAEGLLAVMRSLAERAREHQQTLLPGYTHLQPAQPVTLAHHLLAYVQMFKRDFQRIEDCRKRVRVSPLGAAALAGTTYPLDPEYTAGLLGFKQVFANSMDAVSDRDFVLEGLFVAGVIMTHLSKLCEELILWANPLFGFVRLPDAFATGSSIMPQKKNPDVPELMRGKTGQVLGELYSLFTVLKGLPLSYNRDLQEDKPGFIRTDKAVDGSLRIMSAMIQALQFDPRKMEQAIRSGFLNATELADYLVAKGVPFRQAHRMTGRLVALAESRGLGLEDLSLEEMRGIAGCVEADVFEALEYQTAVDRRRVPGGTGFASVASQLQSVEQWLDQKEASGAGGSV